MRLRTAAGAAAVKQPPGEAATRLIHGGRNSRAWQGAVNPPVYHASTVLFESVAALRAASANPHQGLYYGRYGTPTHFAFCDLLAELEQGAGAVTTGSGLAAITTALLACLKAGDHLLMTDSVYAPTRHFCDAVLSSLGVETQYYDPLIGADIQRLIRPNTRAVFTESPGSLTFEVQDLPAIAQVAHAAGAVVLIDNTWATPLGLKPLTLGADIVIHAATKYLVGHADAMLGAIVANDAWFERIRRTAIGLGQCGGPDDVYLALRGMRTLATRLPQHEATAVQLARWFAERPEVERVLCPQLTGDAGNPLWLRDFTGGCGLFGVVLKDAVAPRRVDAMLDALTLFGMGYSWGGFESLMLPMDFGRTRTATAQRWAGKRGLRVHAGLEDVADLLADLEQAFAKLTDD